MVYLLKIAIFHGYVSHNQMVYLQYDWVSPSSLLAAIFFDSQAAYFLLFSIGLNPASWSI